MATILTRLKGWRTRLIALAHLAFGAVALVDPNMLQMVASDDAQARRMGYLLMAQGVGLYLLRQVTTTPPGKSE